MSYLIVKIPSAESIN